MPAFYIELHNGEFVTIAFGYTSQTPISISKQDEAKYAAMMHNYFVQSGKKLGDKIDGLTIQIFKMGLPPCIYNIGNISAHWDSEKNISVSIG